MSVDGHWYCWSKSSGEKLPYAFVRLHQEASGLVLKLTSVCIPISQPAMFTPASHTAPAWAARPAKSVERKAILFLFWHRDLKG